MSRILIADDHALVRAGYKQFLAEEPAVTEIGEAASGREVREALRCGNWELLLLDIHLPDCSGLDILQSASSTYPSLQVLIISGLPEEQYARNVLRAGARGYVSKSASPEELLRAVRLVLGGRRYVSASLAESLIADFGNMPKRCSPAHSSLPNRDFQIFCKLAAGMPISGIAAELKLSVKTVSTHRSRILHKMRFESNADITAYAIRNRLI
jgi:two-component system invasion response regulator UvrY